MPKALSLVAVLALAASMAASAADPAPRAVTIEIRAMKYAPDTLTIPPGTKVTWINKDEAPHTVTDRARGFASAALDSGERFSHTFDAAGEFNYFCAIHPFMVAKVIVRPAGATR